MVFIGDKGCRFTSDILEFFTNRFSLFDENLLDENTIVLVTGGSGGLGLELVKRLLVCKNKVIIVDIHPPTTDFGTADRVVFYRCDITDYDQVEELYNRIKYEHGTVSILLNNAGLTSISLLKSSSNDDMRRVIDVNFIGAYNMIQIFLPEMIKNNRGYVVNIASILGVITPARLSSYGASKAGLIALHISITRYLRSNYGKNNIKTLLVCPGKLKTTMFQNVETPSKFLAPDVEPSKLAKRILTSIECNATNTLSYPYYTNIVPFFKELNWPHIKAFKKFSGMNKVTAI
ncbi:hypothetical protein HG535_0D01660 [Zygotorulaspora mrakii]|uniref:Oxidoreductase n=1 Tax=Zygotorulaspora mrakii TaxID=42260 RepID=A0A7H9B1E1_ZYGMR|nr:uncharacterized protein HG535_0D01660 [Zygotorulaspora mrakii]QLG72458.1 hypothetical protein HG535_0D01660 [Zygotorulaspora mrakii]